MSEIKEYAARLLKRAKRSRKHGFNAIVFAIETDILDRRGLKHEWRHIEPDVKSEIRRTWREIIKQAMEERSSDTEAKPT